MLSTKAEFARNNFRYPMHALATTRPIQRCCKESDFMEVTYLCTGCNSVIYTASVNQDPIIVKMLKANLVNPIIAEHEIDVETRILSKLNHPNIIEIKGAGRNPRAFIIVEYLAGGTLASLLHKHETKRESSFLTSFSTSSKRDTHLNQGLPIKFVLKAAIQLISAVKYLHEDISPIATVIHRGSFESFIRFHTLISCMI